MANDNEVIIHVKAEDDTAAGFAKAKQSAKKFGEELERDLAKHGQQGGRKLADGIHDGFKQGIPRIKQQARSLGEDVEDIMARHGRAAGVELGQGVSDGFGTHEPDLRTQASALGAEMEAELGEAGRKSGESFAEEFKERSGKGGDDDLLKDIIEHLLRGSKQGGKKVAKSLMTSIADELVGAKNPAIAGAIVASLATIGPLIGASIGAAVIGIGGTLGIAGGFAAATTDPRVKGSIAAMSDMLSDDIKEAGSSFAPAAIDGINQVKAAWKTILPDIQSIFDQSGTMIEPFVDGLLDGVAAIVAGIDESLGGAGPVMEAFGDLFRSVGEDIGEIFSDLSDNGPELADSLAVLAGAISAVGDILTWTVEASAGWLAQFPALKRDAIELAENLRPLGEMLGILEDQTGAVSIENGEWHDSAIDAASAVDEQIASIRVLEAEMKKQTDPMFAMLDAQDQVRLAQEKYNKAVKESGPESAKARDALRKMGEAAIDLSGKMTTAASDGFDGKLTPAMRAAMRQAGLSSKEMDRLEKELMAAWRASNKWAGDYYANYTVKYSTVGKKTGDFGAGGNFTGVGGLAHGGVAGAAVGGMHSGLRMVGEFGPELVDLPAGTRVTSAPDTQRMLSGGNAAPPPAGFSASTMQRLNLTFDPAGASELVRAIMKTLRAEIRDQGGSVQTVLGVSGVG